MTNLYLTKTSKKNLAKRSDNKGCNVNLKFFFFLFYIGAHFIIAPKTNRTHSLHKQPMPLLCISNQPCCVFLLYFPLLYLKGVISRPFATSLFTPTKTSPTLCPHSTPSHDLQFHIPILFPQGRQHYKHYRKR